MTSSVLDAITADLAVPHAFLGRRGGVSEGLYASLNCGVGSADDPVAVTENRRRAADHLGAPLTGVHQVHSPDVVVRDGPSGDRPKADAQVTATPGVALGVLTADCMPVLFACGEGRVVGAAHAGWKGALGGVLEATAAAMRDLGAGTIRAAIGPCIGPDAYEVGPEFRDRFEAADRFFRRGRGDRWLFDLPRYGSARLAAAGVEAAWTGHCTWSDPERFFSYRRTTQAGEADYGRLLAAIRLP